MNVSLWNSRVIAASLGRSDCMNLRKRSSLPLLTFLLATALLLVPVAAAGAVERTVSASAEATIKVPNDSAKLGFGVAAENRSRTVALRTASQRLRRVLAAINRFPGVSAGEISTGRVAVEEVRRNGMRRFRASERVGVVLHDPKRAGALIDAGVAAGAVNVSGPNYFVGDTEAAFTKALAKAFGLAKARAQTLASQAGATLGNVISIDEGEGLSFGYLESGAKDAGAGDAVESPSPVRPGASTVTAYVHATFALQ